MKSTPRVENRNVKNRHILTLPRRLQQVKKLKKKIQMSKKISSYINIGPAKKVSMSTSMKV